MSVLSDLLSIEYRSSLRRVRHARRRVPFISRHRISTLVSFADVFRMVVQGLPSFSSIVFIFYLYLLVFFSKMILESQFLQADARKKGKLWTQSLCFSKFFSKDQGANDVPFEYRIANQDRPHTFTYQGAYVFLNNNLFIKIAPQKSCLRYQDARDFIWWRVIFSSRSSQKFH